MTSNDQVVLDKKYEDFMSSLKEKDSVLYYQLRSKEKPVKESS
jgi:hypothetical protein